MTIMSYFCDGCGKPLCNETELFSHNCPEGLSEMSIAPPITGTNPDYDDLADALDSLGIVAAGALGREERMRALVDRFLRWPLPESVYPDAGKFDPVNNRWRSGTNLLTAEEARQMLEYVLAGPNDAR